jgi:tetratricopeptide (TPR) repeat protein
MDRLLGFALAAALAAAGTAASTRPAVAAGTIPPTAKAYRDEGARLLQDHRYQEAITALRKAVGVASDYAEAWVDIGNAELALNQFSGAARSFRSALAARPDLPVAQYNLAYAYRKAGDHPKAAEAYRLYLQSAPNDADAYYGLAESLRAAGDGVAAAEAYDRYASLETRPDRAQWVEQARATSAQLRTAAGNGGPIAPPPSPGAHASAAPSGAGKASPSSPSSPSSPISSGARPQATAAAARPAAAGAAVEKTRAQTEPGWSNDSDWDLKKKGKPVKNAADLRPYGFELGLRALKDGNFEAALGPLEAAARAKKDDALILAALAGAQLGLRELEQAEASYQEALRHASPDAQAPIQFGLAEAKRLKGDDAGAIAAYQRVLDDGRAAATIKKAAGDRLARLAGPSLR